MTTSGEIRLDDGRRVAYLSWGKPEAPLVLALHGWLDNAESFRPLAAHLNGVHLVALDLPGHGHSSHKATPYVFVDWLDDLYRITRAAGWQRFILLGHSLGALIGSAYAGVFPEQVSQLIMLEGMGPLSQPDHEVPGQIRRVLERRSRTALRRHPGFEEVAQAVAARCQVSDMQVDAARLIVQRNLEEREGRWHWRSDPALRERTPLRMSEGQALALLSAITAPVLLLRGEHGYPELAQQWAARGGAIAALECAMVPGGHHFHMEDPALTALHIEKFCRLR
ncbi:alpha/beta fold hydrolase [Aeromonas simiae]|uniref:alpha/beta fold hydrolase n=1 Tax=Aeromonas simiae TaxID=218936 RepID=UPI0005A89E81|nr:alpha/beta hydrolase [Aeromonas simiae]